MISVSTLHSRNALRWLLHRLFPCAQEPRWPHGSWSKSDVPYPMADCFLEQVGDRLDGTCFTEDSPQSGPVSVWVLRRIESRYLSEDKISSTLQKRDFAREQSRQRHNYEIPTGNLTFHNPRRRKWRSSEAWQVSGRHCHEQLVVQRGSCNQPTAPLANHGHCYSTNSALEVEMLSTRADGWSLIHFIPTYQDKTKLTHACLRFFLASTITVTSNPREQSFFRFPAFTFLSSCRPRRPGGRPRDVGASHSKSTLSRHA
ncbi:hypothetical protein QBC45DRAFT_43461 [Copromyces sp. CBS 386.78]|nr:hypothetical protein QBC45DRAFT_43461 [Copromyces sp. CBS 386.78]